MIVYYETLILSNLIKLKFFNVLMIMLKR